MKSGLTTFLVFFCFSAAFSQIPKGDRIISYQVDMAENANYDSAYNYATQACIESIHLAFSWKDMEPTPGNISGPTYNLLDIVNLYYPAYGTSVELNIPVVNTVVREVPSDLVSLPFSHPSMINRFKVLLDSIFTKIPNVDLSALTIGNESDIFWGSDSTKYQDFKIFLDSASAYAKNIYLNLHGKDLKIGTTMTHKGIVSVGKSQFIKQLNQNTDVISLTYYGTGSNGEVIDPNDVISEFNELVSQYPDTNQPLYIVECGYPSSPYLKSSDEKQRQFVQKVFEAWDINYDNIKYLSFFKTTDWSQAAVDTLAIYYGLPNDTAFKEFLRTLGLRTYPGNGSNKAAYEQLKCELSDRTWCSTTCNPVGMRRLDKKSKAFKIYPNPSSGMISVATNSSHFQIEIFNALGEMVFSKNLTNDENIELPASLVTGLYIVKFNSGNFIASERLFLQRD